MSTPYTDWALFDANVANGSRRWVLWAMAEHADPDGYCFPSLAKLCAMTRLSESAVKQHKRALRDAGALREETRLDRNGRQTSNGIWLNRAWREEVEISAETVEETADALQDQSEGDTVCPPAREAEFASRRGQNMTPHYIEPLPEITKEEERARAHALESDFQKLVSIFNPGSTENLHKGRMLFAALSDEERSDALKHAKMFLSELGREKRKVRTIAIATYLGDRRWEAVARRAGLSVTERNGGFVYVLRGTPALEAWAQYGRMPVETLAKGCVPVTVLVKDDKSSEMVRVQRMGIIRPTLWPPGFKPADLAAGEEETTL